MYSSAFSKPYPEARLLGEEIDIKHQQQLLDSEESLCCLGYIDGTSNFAAGMPYFLVSLARIDRSQINFGLIYDPIHNEELLFASKIVFTKHAS